jgi:hypothetical protein
MKTAVFWVTRLHGATTQKTAIFNDADDDDDESVTLFKSLETTVTNRN